MFAKSIIIAACAAALFVAGCGNKEAKEKADKDVAFYRARLEEQKPFVVDIVNVAKNGKEPGDKALAEKWTPILERMDKLLASPPDASQLADLKATSDSIGDAKRTLQEIVDKATDDVHQANEKVKRAIGQ
jgi:outer membrane murein-binding lipoprotein Lpp